MKGKRREEKQSVREGGRERREEVRECLGGREGEKGEGEKEERERKGGTEEERKGAGRHSHLQLAGRGRVHVP